MAWGLGEGREGGIRPPLKERSHDVNIRKLIRRNCTAVPPNL